MALAIAMASVFAAVGPAGQASADIAAPTLTITAPSTATHGKAVTFTGSLTVADSPAPAGTPVDLERRSGSTWSVVDSATTDATGAVSFTRAAGATADWRLHHTDDGTTPEATSTPTTVVVRVALTATWSHSGVRVNHRRTLHGNVAPGHKAVRLERKVGARWRLVSRLPVAADGSFRTAIRPTSVGFEHYRVVRAADASHLGAVATLKRLDVYRLHTYVVRTRGHIRADMTVFRAIVAQTYADPRGWMRGHHRFKSVSTGGDYTVVLAQAKYLPSYAAICSRMWSCRAGRNVVINQSRWRHGSPYFPGSLTQYRQMVIDHETGHWLGMRHAYCTSKGALAPVMQQQSKGMQGCRPNAWPLPREIRAVR